MHFMVSGLLGSRDLLDCFSISEIQKLAVAQCIAGGSLTAGTFHF